MTSKKSSDDLIANAQEEEFYRELPFPMEYLPRPGSPVGDMALISTVLPLLEGTHAILVAIGEAQEHAALDVGAHHATILLASQVELCISILNRWWEEHHDGDRR